MTDLARLVVKLEAQNAQFLSEMEKSRKQLGGFEASVRKTVASIKGQFIGLAAGFSIGAIVGFVKHAADAADQQRDLAESVGLTATQLSALNYAIIQDGGDSELLGKALFKVNEQLGEAATKGGNAAKTFEKFGISVADIRDGTVGTDEALKRIADKFESMPDGVQKSSLAAELLGTKLGQRLIPFLNEGSAGLKRLADQGKEAGAVMDEKTSKAVARAKDQLDALSQTLQTKTLVALKDFADFFGLIAHTTPEEKIGDMQRDLIKLNAQLDILLSKKNSVLGRFAFTAEDERELQRVNALMLLTNEAMERQIKLRDAPKPDKPKDKPIFVDDENKKKLDAQIVSLKEQEATLGQTSIQIELYKLKQLGAKDATIEWARGVLTLQQNIKDTKSVIDDIQTPIEELRAKIVRLNELRNTNGADGQPLLSDEQYRAGVAKATAQFDAIAEKAKQTGMTMTEYWVEAAHNMQDAFAAFLFDPFKDGLEGMLRDFGRIIQQMAAQAAAAEIFSKLTAGAQGGSFGSFIQGIFTSGATSSGTSASTPPARAGGGVVSAGMPYIVGEVGKELFVPDSSGYIVPHEKMGQMGGSVTQVFNINTPDANSFRSSQRQIQRSGRRSLGV